MLPENFSSAYGHTVLLPSFSGRVGSLVSLMPSFQGRYSGCLQVGGCIHPIHLALRNFPNLGIMTPTVESEMMEVCLSFF